MPKFDLTWKSEIPELTENDQLHLARELVWLEQSNQEASDLLFHHVQLTSDESGPTILIYGKENNPNTLFLYYTEVIEWITLKDSVDTLENL